jgi:hypothetical protein
MYRSFLSAGLFALALHASAQSFVHRVLVLNEGYFDYFGTGEQVVPVTLGSYDPATGAYATVATITGPRFGSDVLVDGSSVFVAADDRVLRFDADSYVQTGEVFVQGVRKLAVWNDQLLITRGELGGLDHYLEVRDKNTLEFLYAVSPEDGLVHSAEDILVLEDKAYLAVNNSFDWDNVVGRVGVLDLQTGTYGNEVDLGPEGRNPERLMVHEGDIIAFNNKDFTGSSISRIAVDDGTLTYTNNVSLNSGCAASALVEATEQVYYMEYDQGELARYDLVNAEVADTLAGSPSVYGLIEDPINGVLYGTTTDYFSSGDLHVLSLDGQVQGTVPVGVAPGNLALDIRSATAVPERSVVQLAAFPNPAQDHLTITGLRAAQALVYVLDATGRTVLEIRVQAAHERGVLAVAALPAGVYTAHVPGQGVVRFTKE